ncbi:hypothetical protein LCGC14_0462390 [marine sediment metagenome]|uniref:Uncharacterized protein n=1 Tax=marine sediment metagenome TaxID=412755 RepID=A0A0F9SET9_9ZZZZ
MTIREKFTEIVFEIYRRQYKEANPSADFDILMKKGETKIPDWFMRYYLPMDRQNKIIEKVCEEMKVKGWMKRQVETEVHIGSSPNSSKKTWLEERKKSSDKGVKNEI